jgi:putative FmdB family regulatory protein
VVFATGVFNLPTKAKPVAKTTSGTIQVRMPLYEYKCQSCGKTFEVIQKFADEPLKIHAECGGVLEKLFSAPAFHLKGTGWYATDYGKGNGKTTKSDESKSDSKSEKTESNTESSSSSNDSKSGSESKSESKSKSDSGTSSESKPSPVT